MKKISSKTSPIYKAFSLIELSVVILIIALLMFGTVSSSNVLTSVKNSITKDRMEIIYNSIGNFLFQNKRLPCPASINSSKDDITNYGKEIRDSVSRECTGIGIYSPVETGNEEFLVFGMVPIKDLNISADFAEDGFGNKFSYYIDKRFAKDFISDISNDPLLSVPSFGTVPSKNIIYIKNRVPSGEIIVNSDAVIAIISHGANAFGSFNNRGVQNVLNVNSQELGNIATNFSGNNANFDRVFYASNEVGQIFDDIILFKTRDDFVMDFGMMSIIPCRGNDINDEDFNKTSVYFGDTVSSSVTCPIPFESIKKIKKCDNFGRWIDIVSRCPGDSNLNCNISSGTTPNSVGIKSKIVKANTQGSDGECMINYAGSYSWSCSSSGVGSVTSNNCVPYCVFQANNGMAEVIAPPNQEGEGPCSAGYKGYFTWSCNNLGVGTVVNNNCTL